MKPAVSTLTISFEAPFWVGLYEREEEGLYQVCKIPFGAEPKDYEVYAFLQRHWKDLTFSPPLPAGTVPRTRINPKRLQREVRKQLQAPAIGTKAQQALQLQHAQRVQTRKETARQKRTQAQHRRAALRREYIDSVKANLAAQLDSTYLVEPDGTKHKLPKKPS